MVFSTNQVRQLYVAKTYAASVSAMTSAAGNIAVVKQDDHFYFEFVGVDGKQRSDLIPIANVLSAKATPAASIADKYKQVTIALDSSLSSTVVAGEDYILNVRIAGYIGLGDENVETKVASVRGTSGMSASTLYAKLAINLAQNLSKEVSPLLNVYVVAASGNTAVTASTKESALTDTYTGIMIEEAEQPWTLGIQEQCTVDFTVATPSITVGKDEGAWATTSVATASRANSGKKIADLEYFCMGERGDIYRNVNWPNSIPTTYLVDATKDYNTLDIHFAYVGGGENPQKSEKTVTIVSDSTSVLNSVIGAVNTAAGLSIATL